MVESQETGADLSLVIVDIDRVQTRQRRARAPAGRQGAPARGSHAPGEFVLA